MRLRRLNLLRYGHLTDAELTFPADAALHVVHGANEAGKSTALAAIGDALFGFPHRTPFDFLHPAAQLRIGFTLADEDGKETDFIRRKGNRDTLLDANGAPLPEQALRPFLGGADRIFFERGFGLDGPRLRQGARELQAIGGDAGGSLLAGSGLLNLHGVLKTIDDQAKALFGDGRGRRRLSESLDQFQEARKAAEERAVPPRAWQEQEDARTKAVAELEQVQARIRTLGIEANRLERYRRVAPIRAALAIERDHLAKVADAPALPPDAAARRAHALAELRQSRLDHAREADAVEQLTGKRDALVPDAAILAAQDAIDALDRRRAIAEQAAQDLPEVLAQSDRHRIRVVAALTDLPPGLSPEAAVEVVPAAGKRQRVQRLITRHSELATRAEAARHALAGARRKHDQAQLALAAASLPPAPRLLRQTVNELRAEGRLDDEIAKAAIALREAQAASAAALATLAFWQGDLATLRACRLPLPAESTLAASRLDAAADLRAKAAEALSQHEAETLERQAELSRLSAGETMPTPAAITAARSRRDEVWRHIRKTLDGAPPDAEVDVSPATLPAAFEGLRDAADRLADRRAEEAQRVSDYLACEARLASLHARQPLLTQAQAESEGNHAAAQEAWRALWAPSGVAAHPAAVLEEWCRARERVLARADAADDIRRGQDELLGRRHRTIAALTSLVPTVAEASTVGAALRLAETACAAEEAAAAAYAELDKAVMRALAPLAEVAAAEGQAAAALEAWQADWEEALRALNLSDRLMVEEAHLALAAWGQIAEVAEAWRSDQARVTNMRRAIADFEAEVRSLQVNLTEEDGRGLPSLVAASLARRLADARQATATTAELDELIVTHRAAGEDALRRITTAGEELAQLCGLAGAVDDAGLALAIDRAQQREAALAGIARLTVDLARQADGRDEAALDAEYAGVETDAAVARLDDIRDEITRLGEKREALSATRTLAEQQLAAMFAGRDAASKAQEAADALAAARGHAEHYARLHVARELLRAGIERFRRDRQGPLLRAAGAHFALLTGGRYRRLGADEDAPGQVTLHAVREDQTECPMEALSEGTRDQFYLALRIAGIEAHVAQGTPLPFIADDLLVNFDDRRAAAAISLLAQLGRSTQTILFTHHAHIAALAAEHPGVAVHRLS
ncbi:AAA family ATPase [Humitalea sp. 24SJ18S-53]|uniref:AAA family ATPase n=1 Tax=Humitalea sp. 24SJ18S-53 TaxID=3422307 RepID=UPI003D67CCEE